MKKKKKRAARTDIYDWDHMPPVQLIERHGPVRIYEIVKY